MSGQDHIQGDSNKEKQKPLRKARYVWEVKGKYHVRKTVESNRELGYDNYSEPSTSSVQIPRCVDVETSITDSVDSHFQNYLADAKELMSESIRDGIDNWAMNEYVDINPTVIRCTREPDEDCYMQQWHANQLARGFMDNTINTVLETWLTTPLEADRMEDRQFNSSNDGQVEDDSILIAIQSHGLRGTGEYLPVHTVPQENLLNSHSDSIKSSVNPIYSELDHERDPNNFLYAAVSAAIQENGLSFGCS